MKLITKGTIEERIIELQEKKKTLADNLMVENGSHGYYTAQVAKEIIEQYFNLKEIEDEDRTAIPYTEQEN